MIKRKNTVLKDVIFEHVRDNIKEYFTITIIFIIGIILGVILINNLSIENQEEISLYINTFIKDIKENKSINIMNLLKRTLANNITLAIILWFVSSTVIGAPLVYAIIGFRGFCLGYTISSIIATVGTINGILFSVFRHLITKHNIYTKCVYISCKRNKIIQIDNEGQTKREYKNRNNQIYNYYIIYNYSINNICNLRNIHIYKYAYIICTKNLNIFIKKVFTKSSLFDITYYNLCKAYKLI